MLNEIARAIGASIVVASISLLALGVAGKAHSAEISPLTGDELAIMGNAYGAMNSVKEHCGDRYATPLHAQFTAIIVALYNAGDTRAFDAAMKQSGENGAISGVQGWDATCDLLANKFPTAILAK